MPTRWRDREPGGIPRRETRPPSPRLRSRTRSSPEEHPLRRWRRRGGASGGGRRRRLLADAATGARHARSRMTSSVFFTGSSIRSCGIIHHGGGPRPAGFAGRESPPPGARRSPGETALPRTRPGGVRWKPRQAPACTGESIMKEFPRSRPGAGGGAGKCGPPGIRLRIEQVIAST